MKNWFVKHPKRHLIIEALPQTSYKNFTEVMDIANKLGAGGIALSKKPPSQQGVKLSKEASEKQGIKQNQEISQRIIPPTYELVIRRNHSSQPSNTPDLIINIIKKGEYLIGDTPATSDNLEKVVKSKLDNTHGRNVILRPDPELIMGDFSEVMKAINWLK
jgi:biopolymer transport protein ExbD